MKCYLVGAPTLWKIDTSRLPIYTGLNDVTEMMYGDLCSLNDDFLCAVSKFFETRM